MPATTLLAVFVAGLLGGGHCVAMCGGIVGALSGSGKGGVLTQFAYNAGRIGSYAVAGAIAGMAGGLILAKNILPLQIAMYVGTNLLLVALGSYLAGWSGLASILEAPGRPLWKKLSPLIRRVVPADTLPRAFLAGTVWGWLPCGLTYSVLTLAMLSDGAAAGAGLMAAFGLGTLPSLLLAGTMVQGATRWLRMPLFRRIAGAVVIAAGVTGLAHASDVAEQLRQGLFCLP